MVIELLSYLKTVGEVIRDKSGSLKKVIVPVNSGRNSIREKAKNAIMQFPVLISSSVSKKSSLLIKKALEAEYANLIRIAISLNGVVHVNEEDGVVDFIKGFHNNMSNFHSNPASMSQAVGADVRDLDAPIRGMFSDSVEVNKLKPVLNMGIFNDEMLLKEAIEESMQIAEFDLNENVLNDLTLPKYFNEAEKKDDSIAKIDGGLADSMRTSLSATDVKKANDMLPTMIDAEVEFVIYGRTKDGEARKASVRKGQMLLGVQTVQHLVPTNEMIYFVSRSIKEKNLIFRTIQWTTGEIKFFKDLILSLDRIKEENSGKKNVSSMWWRRLRYMSNSNKIRTFFKQKKHIPISTVVMSMEEIEYLKNTQGIDLTKSQVATSLMDVFLLLGFVIMDEVDEMAWVFDYESGFYKHYSYSALEKESKDAMSPELKALLAMAAKNR